MPGPWATLLAQMDPGWDLSGNANEATRGAHVFQGLRTLAQPFVPRSTCPSSLETGQASVRPEARARNFTIYDSTYDSTFFYKRPLTFDCIGNCTGEKIHKALWTHKYELSDMNWQLKSGGVVDSKGTCRLPSNTGCDFAMRHKYIMEFEADPNVYAFALPYFGNASAAIANATEIYDKDGNRPTYNRETMGIKVWVEPLSGAPVLPLLHAQPIATRCTGATVKVQIDLFLLKRIDKAIFDSAERHGNIFTGSNPDSIYLPNFRLVVVDGAEPEETRSLVNAMGAYYTLMLWISLGSIFYLIWLATPVVFNVLWETFFLAQRTAKRQLAVAQSAERKAEKIMVKSKAANKRQASQGRVHSADA
eukprot:2968941-Prymnesium_polylepis.1